MPTTVSFLNHPPLKKGDNRGILPMLPYDRRLKTKARSLRTNPTDAERRLWYRLRRKQILGVQFYRQKPIGNLSLIFMHQPENWSSNSTALSIWSTDRRHTTPIGPGIWSSED